MKAFVSRLERVMAAVAFAEVAEYGLAESIAGNTKPIPASGTWNGWDRSLKDITWSEAGCHEWLCYA